MLQSKGELAQSLSHTQHHACSSLRSGMSSCVRMGACVWMRMGACVCLRVVVHVLCMISEHAACLAYTVYAACSACLVRGVSCVVSYLCIIG